MKIGPLVFFRYYESHEWYCNWTCPFCGSAGLGAIWRFLFFGTRKLHPCKDRLHQSHTGRSNMKSEAKP